MRIPLANTRSCVRQRQAPKTNKQDCCRAARRRRMVQLISSSPSSSTRFEAVLELNGAGLEVVLPVRVTLMKALGDSPSSLLPRSGGDCERRPQPFRAGNCGLKFFIVSAAAREVSCRRSPDAPAHAAGRRRMCIRRNVAVVVEIPSVRGAGASDADRQIRSALGSRGRLGPRRARAARRGTSQRSRRPAGLSIEPRAVPGFDRETPIQSSARGAGRRPRRPGGPGLMIMIVIDDSAWVC
jgi:hypothetical protein